MHEETAFINRNFVGDATTADQRVLNEENDSRLQHRYAVVVQDLDFYEIQSCPTKNKSAQETMKSLQTVML